MSRHVSRIIQIIKFSAPPHDSGYIMKAINVRSSLKVGIKCVIGKLEEFENIMRDGAN